MFRYDIEQVDGTVYESVNDWRVSDEDIETSVVVQPPAHSSLSISFLRPVVFYETFIGGQRLDRVYRGSANASRMTGNDRQL
jgi:hypothetical protein